MNAHDVIKALATQNVVLKLDGWSADGAITAIVGQRGHRWMQLDMYDNATVATPMQWIIAEDENDPAHMVEFEDDCGESYDLTDTAELLELVQELGYVA